MRTRLEDGGNRVETSVDGGRVRTSCSSDTTADQTPSGHDHHEQGDEHQVWTGLGEGGEGRIAASTYPACDGESVGGSASGKCIPASGGMMRDLLDKGVYCRRISKGSSGPTGAIDVASTGGLTGCGRYKAKFVPEYGLNRPGST